MGLLVGLADKQTVAYRCSGALCQILCSWGSFTEHLSRRGARFKGGLV